jgi:hypothetical protein
MDRFHDERYEPTKMYQSACIVIGAIFIVIGIGVFAWLNGGTL